MLRQVARAFVLREDIPTRTVSKGIGHFFGAMRINGFFYPPDHNRLLDSHRVRWHSIDRRNSGRRTVKLRQWAGENVRAGITDAATALHGETHSQLRGRVYCDPRFQPKLCVPCKTYQGFI